MYCLNEQSTYKLVQETKNDCICPEQFVVTAYFISEKGVFLTS